MSPRSKENLINKIKVEHLIWRIDTAFERRDVEHKIVERDDEIENKKITPKSKSSSKISSKSPSLSKSKILSAVDKISIL